MIYFHSSSVVFAGIINKCSDTEKQNYETGAGALVESNNFSDPSVKVRDAGVDYWTVSAAGFVAPGNDAHLVPNT